MKTFLIIMVVIFAVLIIVASVRREEEANSEALTQSLWVATQLNDEDLISETTILAEFNEEGVVGGSTGCNNYTTSYSVDRNRISFGEEVAMTRKLCEEDVNLQEAEYLEALNDTKTFEIKDETLKLIDSDNEVLVEFEAQSQDLEGSSWDVLAYNNSKGGVASVIAGSEMTAEFGEEGQLSGSSGCNSYSTTYEVDGEKISISTPAVTFMFCSEPEGVMDQEVAFLGALETATTYRIEGNSLKLSGEDGSTVADFTRSAE